MTNPPDRLETCGSCEHYFEGDPDKRLQRATMCRRYPPQPFPMQDSRGQMGNISLYPAVQSMHWCGEFKAKSRYVQ